MVGVVFGRGWCREKRGAESLERKKVEVEACMLGVFEALSGDLYI